MSNSINNKIGSKYRKYHVKWITSFQNNYLLVKRETEKSVCFDCVYQRNYSCQQPSLQGANSQCGFIKRKEKGSPPRPCSCLGLHLAFSSLLGIIILDLTANRKRLDWKSPNKQNLNTFFNIMKPVVWSINFLGVFNKNIIGLDIRSWIKKEIIS